LPNKPVRADRPSRFFARDFNACGVAGGGTTGALARFVNADTYSVADTVQKNAREIFDVCIQNVPKIRDGRPTLIARYVTTGNYQSPEALEVS
jgi:hypothetical protein